VNLSACERTTRVVCIGLVKQEAETKRADSTLCIVVGMDIYIEISIYRFDIDKSYRIVMFNKM